MTTPALNAFSTPEVLRNMINGFFPGYDRALCAHLNALHCLAATGKGVSETASQFSKELNDITISFKKIQAEETDWFNSFINLLKGVQSLSDNEKQTLKQMQVRYFRDEKHISKDRKKTLNQKTIASFYNDQYRHVQQQFSQRYAYFAKNYLELLRKLKESAKIQADLAENQLLVSDSAEAVQKLEEVVNIHAKNGSNMVLSSANSVSHLSQIIPDEGVMHVAVHGNSPTEGSAPVDGSVVDTITRKDGKNQYYHQCRLQDDLIGHQLTETAVQKSESLKHLQKGYETDEALGRSTVDQRPFMYCAIPRKPSDASAIHETVIPTYGPENAKKITSPRDVIVTTTTTYSGSEIDSQKAQINHSISSGPHSVKRNQPQVTKSKVSSVQTETEVQPLQPLEQLDNRENDENYQYLTGVSRRKNVPLNIYQPTPFLAGTQDHGFGAYNNNLKANVFYDVASLQSRNASDNIYSDRYRESLSWHQGRSDSFFQPPPKYLKMNDIRKVGIRQSSYDSSRPV